MMPLDIAMKLASASTGCQKSKCPFMSKCKGDYSTCVMKEIALMLRSMHAEIQTKDSIIRGLHDILISVQQYTQDLEKINKRYHDVVLAFQQGYRPKKKIRRPYKPRKNKTPEEMDGDERYAFEPPSPNEPPPPTVVI